ncbi:MAG: adaptor protein MecA, partial [Oscillospiraceae bacterium]
DVRGVCAVAEKYIYKFTDFDGVCDAAREIATVFIGKSVLYKACESFYLCLEPIDMYGFVETENILLEFSDKQKNSNIVFGQLCEHGKLMIDNNAVGALFDNFSISK